MVWAGSGVAAIEVCDSEALNRVPDKKKAELKPCTRGSPCRGMGTGACDVAVPTGLAHCLGRRNVSWHWDPLFTRKFPGRVRTEKLLGPLVEQSPLTVLTLAPAVGLIGG